eukprot:IDg10260t1
MSSLLGYEELLATVAMVSAWTEMQQSNERTPRVRESAAGLAPNRERLSANSKRRIKEDYCIGKNETHVDASIGAQYTEAEFERHFRISRS